MTKTYIAKEELLTYHALASLRKPELTNDIRGLVDYFKSEFKLNVEEKDLYFLLEPLIEEDINDLQLIMKNVG